MMNGADITVCDAEALMQLFPYEIGRINLKTGCEYDYSSLPKKLVDMGYTRENYVESKGAFAVRGDILDIYPVNRDNPVRIDFFGDTVERIRPYDSVSGERLEDVGSVDIICATDSVYCGEDVRTVKSALSEALKNCPDSTSFKRAKSISDDIISKLENGAPFAGASFILPLLKNSCTVFDLLGKDTLVIFD